MNPEHKKYILENVGKKSVRQIAGDLHLKEKVVKRLLEKEKGLSKQADAGFKTDKEGKQSRSKWSIFISVTLIIILGFIVYGNSINGKFVWDDQGLIKENKYIQNSSKLSNIFNADIGRGGPEKSAFYRPMQMLSYMVDYALWNLDYRGYHLTNMMLHILAALCLLWFINVLFKNSLLSFLTAALFVVHPVHTEAVSYISGRADPLALIFILVSFIFYIKSSDNIDPITYLFMTISFMMALLAKESSLIFPVLLLLYHRIFKIKFKVREFFTISAVFLAYILFRTLILNIGNSGPLSHTTLPQRVPGFFVAIASYIRLLLLPLNLHMEYGKEAFPIFDPAAVIGVVILSLSLTYALRKKNNNRLVHFFILWFFIAILPVSNLYPINAYMAEHWLYLPSIGFFAILAYGLDSLYEKKQLRVYAAILTIGLLYFYSYLTIDQNNYWKNSTYLYERTLKYSPDNITLLNNLGNEYDIAGEHEKAMAVFKKAIEIKPEFATSYNNLGNVYYSMGNKAEAAALYRKALELNQNYADARYNLDVVTKELERIE
ncbi:MAG: tetratricopeptide repeat protein [Candidatus Omnitrophota bacterium]|nr:tetratricopeptide repeat protein [Candidatus Omnitrophota bacterium]